MRQTPLAGGVLWDTVVALPSTREHPPQPLRWIRWRHGRKCHELLTNVLEPTGLTAEEALALSPWRWKVERLFFALKEVLNLHRFYLTSPNGVAMQV